MEIGKLAGKSIQISIKKRGIFDNRPKSITKIALDPLYIRFCLFELLFQILSNVQTLLELSRLRTNQILF